MSFPSIVAIISMYPVFRTSAYIHILYSIYVHIYLYIYLYTNKPLDRVSKRAINLSHDIHDAEIQLANRNSRTVDITWFTWCVCQNRWAVHMGILGIHQKQFCSWTVGSGNPYCSPPSYHGTIGFLPFQSQDRSGGCGQSFSIMIESEQFRGLTKLFLVRRHQQGTWLVFT